MEFDAYLDRISARNVGRYDVPALFEEGPVLESVVDDLAAPFRDEEVDAVAGIDALGFVLGTGVALDLGVGLVPVRKGGKLSVPESDVLRRELTDYTGERKVLEVDAERVSAGERVLVVDDWLDTGAQMEAATSLLDAAGATVVGVAALDAERNQRTRSLAAEYELRTVNPETSF